MKDICIRIINENIRAVENNQPLTMPLKELKTDCNFMNFYNDFFNIKNADRIEKELKEKKKAYYQRPEVKAQQKAYYQRPEVKEKKKAYYQKNKEKLK